MKTVVYKKDKVNNLGHTYYGKNSFRKGKLYCSYARSRSYKARMDYEHDSMRDLKGVRD
jgi:hypothetical protein